MASYNGVQAAVHSRPGCRLILAMSLLTTRMAGNYPHSYSQVLCRACQHHVEARGGFHFGTREYLRATLPVSCTVLVRVEAEQDFKSASG